MNEQRKKNKAKIEQWEIIYEPKKPVSSFSVYLCLIRLHLLLLWFRSWMHSFDRFLLPVSIFTGRLSNARIVEWCFIYKIHTYRITLTYSFFYAYILDSRRDIHFYIRLRQKGAQNKKSVKTIFYNTSFSLLFFLFSSWDCCSLCRIGS